MATWAAIANAVQAAIVSGASLTAGAVRWRFQDSPQPALSFIDLSLGTSLEVGQPFVEDDYDATRAAGAEIRLQVKGIREVPLELEVFTPTTTPDEGSAIALCEQAKSSLWLPTIRDALGALGFVPFDAGPVQFVPAIVAVGFRGRATCTIRCTMPAPIVAEYTTWIETISGTIQGKSTAAPWPVVPAAPTVTPHGTVGTTAYAYKGVAHYADGTVSAVGPAGTTDVGPDVLQVVPAVASTGHHYGSYGNQIYFTAVEPGLAGDDITVEAIADGGPVKAWLDCGDLAAGSFDAVVQAVLAGQAGNAIRLALVGDGEPYARASLDCGALAAGHYDAILQAVPSLPYGDWGNSLFVALVGDSPSGVTVSVDESMMVYTIHFEDGVSTVGDVDTAIGLLDPSEFWFVVGTPGTPGTVLHDSTDGFPATTMSGGLDGTAPTINGDDITIHFATGYTVADVENVIAGPLWSLVEVKTFGTDGTVLTAGDDDFALTNLANGNSTDLWVDRVDRALTIHFRPGYSTYAACQAAVNALTGDDRIVVASLADGAAQAFSPLHLSGGAEAVDDFNRTIWTFPTGAMSIDVYRTTGGATSGLIATLTAPTATLDDTGLAGDGATPPPYDSETAIARDFSA